MGLNFKTYLPNVPAYKGGKSKAEISSCGKKVYKLSSNENPIGASPMALEAIKRHIGTIHEYPSPIDTRFRQALSTFYNNELSPNQFVTTNSGVANIELIINAFLDQQSECIYSSPYFSPYDGFSRKVGAKTIDVPLDANNFSINLKGIENAITDKTSLIFITSPNNPTGSYINKKEVEDLLSFLPDHVLLVFDEVYYQFADANDYVRPLPYVLKNENVIAVNSLSKAYGLAGLRIGYSYTTEKVATYLQKFRRPFMLNTLSMEAAIEGIKDAKFIEQTVRLIQNEKVYLYEQLDKIKLKYWKTQANFIMIDPKMDPNVFESQMAEHGIMIRPLAGFGAPSYVRVTIGNRAANEACIKALSMVLKN